jgi:hypothetical protein
MEPLIVSVKEARRLLGGMGNNKFWALAKAGAFQLTGTNRKRFVVVSSLKSYVENVASRETVDPNPPKRRHAPASAA